MYIKYVTYNTSGCLTEDNELQIARVSYNSYFNIIFNIILCMYIVHFKNGFTKVFTKYEEYF